MNRVSVNAIGLTAFALPQQLALIESLDVDCFGLPAVSCEQVGWADALRLLRASRASPLYLCHGIGARGDRPLEWQAEAARLRRMITFAADAGMLFFYFTTGRLGGLLWEEANERFVEFIAPLVEFASERGVTLVLENTMAIRSDISFTHTLKETAAVARATGSQLCIDFYSCWGESGLSETLTGNLDIVAMLQLSDVKVGDLALPNRRVPGDGDIPLEKLLGMTLDLGYAGVIDLELNGPMIAAEGEAAALARGVAWVRQRLPGH